MSRDPNTLQWIIGIGQVAATVGAITVAFFAARSAAASRSATAAESALELQTRPFVVGVPRSDRILSWEEEVPGPDGTALKTSREGEVLLNVNEAWVSAPLRNVGEGMAKLGRVRLYAEAKGPFDDLLVTIAEEYVPPGEQSRVGVQLPPGPARAHFAAAAKMSSGLEIEIDYTDLGGRQPQRVVLALAQRTASTAWRVARAIPTDP